MNVQTLVLLFGAVLLAVGLAGLVPSAFQVLRRRRLISQLASLKVDEDVAHPLFGEGLASHPEEEVAALGPSAVVTVAASTPRAEVRPEVAAAAPPAKANSAAPGASASETASAESEAVVEGAVDDEGEEPAGEEDEDEDDLMALFKDTKVTSSTPAALADAFETVAAGDLLAQAREIRDLLRRSA